MVAQAKVEPFKTYKLKLVVADGFDRCIGITLFL